MNDIRKQIDEKLKDFGSPKSKTEEKKKQTLDTIQEQIESPMTTIYCDESIKDKELSKIHKNPENYIEINMIKKIRMVDNFYIPGNLKNFTYNKIKYDIIEENIYILPTKKGFFMPTSFYYEGNKQPVDFINLNQGITGKGLSLCYEKKSYEDVFSGEEVKYNLFVVVFLIIGISAYAIGSYFLFTGGFI